MWTQSQREYIQQQEENVSRSLRVEQQISQLKEIVPLPEEMPEGWCDYLPPLSVSETDTYKVYHDGSHYIGIVQSHSGAKRERKEKTDYQKLVDSTFDQLCQEQIDDGLKGNALKNRLVTLVTENFPQLPNIEKYVKDRLHNSWLKIYQRKKRFRRKAYLNNWNYFVTLTYDSEKHDENGFRQSLRRCLSNFATRRGWRYMGVFERGEDNDRLHFHAIMYIPNGEMVGDIFEAQHFSTKQGVLHNYNCNSFFKDRFGDNEFEELDEILLQKGNSINYILKYIGKSNERIVTSRGLKGEIVVNLHETQIVCEIQDDYVEKYVLIDNIMDWIRCTLSYGYEQLTFL